MGNRDSDDKFPIIVVDKNNNFASIKLKEGTETVSYLKNGVLFSEDDSGNIIEIQILDLTSFLPSQSDGPSMSVAK